MDFPSNEGKVITAPDFLIDGLGAKPVKVIQSRDLLAIFKNQQEVENIKPNFGILEKVETFGIIISAQGDDCDFVSRFFAPRAGINEDPVTGSAHTTLIPYWSKKLNKKKLEATQLSHRKGKLTCEYKGERVKIAGTAKLFMKGEIFV